MLIHNATVLTFDQQYQVIPQGAVHVVDGVIHAVGQSAPLRERYADDAQWNAGGMILMPGQICAHTHFYGAFARGMNVPGEPAKNFPEILQKLWWRLDKALDLEAVRCSAEVCLVDAIRNGTTTLIDHHSSPNAIDGSLDIIGEAVDNSGLRGVLCYEVTDREGASSAQAGICENVRFIKKIRSESRESRLAATFGLHASMTLSDATLDRCRAEAETLNTGFHIHVAEHPADGDHCVKTHGMNLIDRLERFAVTGPQSIFAHCVHIDDRDRRQIAASGTWVSHQPRSNMNNAVGAASIGEMLKAKVAVCLGNDGFSNDMFVEMKVADLLQKVVSNDPRTLGADKVIQIAVDNNRRLAEVFFAKPLGRIIPGASADLTLLDYYPTTPLTAENLPWHILFGISGGHVHSTVVQGEVLMKNRELITMDEEKIAARSREAAKRTWKRIDS